MKIFEKSQFHNFGIYIIFLFYRVKKSIIGDGKNNTRWRGVPEVETGSQTGSETGSKPIDSFIAGILYYMIRLHFVPI